MPSAIVGRTGRSTGLSVPDTNLASTGEQFSGCAANRRGIEAIWLELTSSWKPSQHPSRELPPPTGTMTLSGTWNPRSSQISYAKVLVPWRKNGCQLWLA